jgi:pimeloyl-ACP methyl ester carboxylesterase
VIVSRKARTAAERTEQPLISLSQIGWFDEGGGEPILLLHSSGASRRQWARLREPWSDRYRTLGIDLWGYGETPLPTRADGFRLSDEVALARVLLRRLDQPFHLVGHSYGGAVALRLALESPDLVRSISVHEPVLFHLLRKGNQTREWDEIRRISQNVLHHVEHDNLNEAARLFVDYWNGEGAWRSLSTTQQVRTAAAARKTPLDFQALFHESDPLERYQTLAGKVLVTVGETTRAPAAKVSELLGLAFGPDSLQVLPRVGHMAPITDPELLRPLIEKRLANS